VASARSNADVPTTCWPSGEMAAGLVDRGHVGDQRRGQRRRRRDFASFGASTERKSSMLLIVENSVWLDGPAVIDTRGWRDR
jgi:hypothetical protein